MLTGNKDTDILILDSLEDRDVFNYCLTNKQASSICRDESFWRNRFFRKISPTREALKFKPEDTTWKQYYLKTVIDIQILKGIFPYFEFDTRISHIYLDDALYIIIELVKFLKNKYSRFGTVNTLKKEIEKSLSFSPKIIQGVMDAGANSQLIWENYGDLPAISELVIVYTRDPDPVEIYMIGVINYFLTVISNSISTKYITGEDILELIRKNEDLSKIFNF